MTEQLLTQRQNLALAKIQSTYGSPEGEFGATMFVAHHLQEIDENYWIETFGTEAPSPSEIIKALVLVSNWSSEDDGHLDMFDFSLPGNVTDYLLSVRFNSDGVVEDVAMES